VSALRSSSGLAERLAARTLELVDIPSVSRSEARIADHVAAAMPNAFELAFRDEDCLLYTLETRDDRPLVVLAGHLDTVPPQDNLPGQIEDGSVRGLGASDMKGGLAVMVELARWIAGEGPTLAFDVGLLFFGKEELSAAESPLPRLFEGWPRLTEAGLAVVLEPTDNAIQAGCLGHVTAELVFDGVSAHSARPWLGVNAIEVAVRGLQQLVDLEPRDVTVSGLRFREVLSPTGIAGGIAGNVIPDRVTVSLSFRYAPNRTPEDAERELRRLVGDVGRLEAVGISPAARVVVDAPLVERLRVAGPFAVEAKQAWTPVAEFTERGVDAVNLGPGAPAYAHTREERVDIAQLVRSYEGFQRFLAAR
jgi:succinyl-diaminopimelate desuccinylase